MPNIENIKKNNFANRTISAQRNEILYREDIKTSFGYALFGITVGLAVAGGIYTIGKKLLA
jgi:hypothetical protein